MSTVAQARERAATYWSGQYRLERCPCCHEMRHLWDGNYAIYPGRHGTVCERWCAECCDQHTYDDYDFRRCTDCGMLVDIDIDIMPGVGAVGLCDECAARRDGDAT